MSEPTVVVMAKAPREGMVKTRLAPMLGAAGCAALQAALIQSSVSLARGVAPTVLAFSPVDAAGEVRRLIGPGVPLLVQADGHLGRRMAAAVAAVSAERPAGGVVLIGTDAPTLPAVTLDAAVRLVRAGRAVLGPARDGGYYLIGLARPLPAVFDLDPVLWGGPQVLAATRQALSSAGYHPALLPPLRDLDTPADATALLADPSMPLSVAAVLREHRRTA